MQLAQDIVDFVHKNWSLFGSFCGFAIVAYHTIASHGGYRGIWRNFSEGYEKPTAK